MGPWILPGVFHQPACSEQNFPGKSQLSTYMTWLVNFYGTYRARKKLTSCGVFSHITQCYGYANCKHVAINIPFVPSHGCNYGFVIREVWDEMEQCTFLRKNSKVSIQVQDGIPVDSLFNQGPGFYGKKPYRKKPH